MPERDRLLHLLAPDVKCPACGGDLTFVPVRKGYDTKEFVKEMRQALSNSFNSSRDVISGDTWSAEQS